MDTKQLSRREFLRLVGLGSAATALTLAGCSAPAQPTVAPTAVPATKAAATAVPVAKDFSFTAWSLNEAASKDVLAEFVANYEKKSGGKAKTASYPYGEYLNQLVLQARGGNISGAAQLDVAWLATLAAMNVLQDLSSVAQGAGYTDAALRAGQFNGKQFALPWTIASIGLVANTELLEKAGISAMPKTIDEFEKALDKAKSLGNDILPYGAMTDVAQLKDIIPWIWTFGGTILKDGKITLGDEGSIKAVEWYKKLLGNKLISPKLNRFDARQLFSQGKIVFYEDAILARGIVAKDSPVKDIAQKITPLSRPTTGSGDPQSLLWGHLLVVFNKEGADAAAQFARYLSSDTDTAVKYFKTMSLPPVTTGALAAPDVKNDAYTIAWGDKITKTAMAHPFWTYAASAQMEKILCEQVQAVLAGASNAKDAMQKANTDITALMK
jgi:multiple sugar transport system substrate-binding protein